MAKVKRKANGVRWIKVYRSSITGRFVGLAAARRWPKRTQAHFYKVAR